MRARQTYRASRSARMRAMSGSYKIRVDVNVTKRTAERMAYRAVPATGQGRAVLRRTGLSLAECGARRRRVGCGPRRHSRKEEQSSSAMLDGRCANTKQQKPIFSVAGSSCCASILCSCRSPLFGSHGWMFLHRVCVVARRLGRHVQVEVFPQFAARCSAASADNFR